MAAVAAELESEAEAVAAESTLAKLVSGGEQGALSALDDYLRCATSASAP